MIAHVALLRAVNVAGHQPVAMVDLRETLGALGFARSQSLLQSGNLVFHSPPRSTAALEALLERELAARLRLGTDVFVRTADEWRDLVANNPFPEAARTDPGHLVAVCLKRAPEAAAVRALQSAITGREHVRAHGSVAYLVYPDGIGRSRVTSALIERLLGTRGTARNWNTVLKLQALAGAGQDSDAGREPRRRSRG
jgi:uncharacterized protein (DUF1697 family)